MVLSHNAGTSAVKWSQVFGEHDKQEQSYSVSKGGSYNSQYRLWLHLTIINRLTIIGKGNI